MIASTHSFGAQPPDELQRRFLFILPRIKTHARIYFRGKGCPGRKADLIAEVVALAWKWFRRLHERGKDATHFPSVLATYAAKAVGSGRRVCGQLPAKDAMSERAQQKHDFTVEHLPSSTCTSRETLYGAHGGQNRLDEFEERLQDNTVTPVPEQVAFRVDWPAWLKTRSERDRRLIREMSRSERTKDLARRFRLSPARISQLRREFCEDWSRFCADRDEP